MTTTYIGLKIVTAWPQDERSAFPNRAFDETDPAANRPGYAVQYEGGYTSWSPKDVFEAAYRAVPDEIAPTVLGALREALEFSATASPADWEDEDHADIGLRNKALDAALRASGGYAGTVDTLIQNASKIEAWLKTGNPNAIAEAEQRGYASGYNAARPLDPNRIEIEP